MEGEEFFELISIFYFCNELQRILLLIFLGALHFEEVNLAFMFCFQHFSLDFLWGINVDQLETDLINLRSTSPILIEIIWQFLWNKSMKLTFFLIWFSFPIYLTVKANFWLTNFAAKCFKEHFWIILMAVRTNKREKNFLPFLKFMMRAIFSRFILFSCELITLYFILQMSFIESWPWVFWHPNAAHLGYGT